MNRLDMEKAISVLKEIALTDPTGEILEEYKTQLTKAACDSYFQGMGKRDTRSIEALRELARRVGGSLEFGPTGGYKENFV